MRKFFRIYRDKFWRLTLLNLVCFVITLPLCMILYICANAVLGIAEGDAVVDILPGLGFYMSLFAVETRAGSIAVYAAVAASALLFGPLKFTLTGTIWDFRAGRYRFFADVLSRLRKKWRQAMALGLIDVIVIGRLATNIAGIQLFYQGGFPPWLLMGLRWLSVFALLFWALIRHYMYAMSYAAELRLWPLLKNCYILAFSSFGRNAECTAAAGLIWALTLLTVPLATVILLPIFSYSACTLATVCAVYPGIETYVLGGKGGTPKPKRGETPSK